MFFQADIGEFNNYQILFDLQSSYRIEVLVEKLKLSKVLEKPSNSGLYHKVTIISWKRYDSSSL